MKHQQAKLEQLSKIEGILNLIEYSIKNGQGLALSTISDLKDITKSIVDITRYTVVNKDMLLAYKIKSLKTDVLYMITPNLINRLDNEKSGQVQYIGRNTFSPEKTKDVVEEAIGAFSWSLSEIESRDFSNADEKTDIIVDLFDQRIKRDFPIHDTEKIKKVYDFCILNVDVFSQTKINFDIFLSCVKSADFSLLYIKGKDHEKLINKKNKFKYLIFSLSLHMGDEWYTLSCESIGFTKSQCSGAGISIIGKWKKDLEEIITTS